MPRPFQKDGRPGAATDLRKYRRVFLEWSVSTGRAHSNVLAGLRNPKRSRAERLAAAANGGRALSDDEIRTLWQSAERFGSFGAWSAWPCSRACAAASLLGSNAAATSSPIVSWSCPSTPKTGEQHEVPLTDLMRSVIAGQPVTTSPLLFPSAVTGGRIRGWTYLGANLQQASGVDFRLHDLRRTTRTLMSRLGVTEDLAELAIGHVRAEALDRRRDRGR